MSELTEPVALAPTEVGGRVELSEQDAREAGLWLAPSAEALAEMERLDLHVFRAKRISHLEQPVVVTRYGKPRFVALPLPPPPDNTPGVGGEGEDGPTDAFHLSCPSCGEAIDLIPESGGTAAPKSDGLCKSEGGEA